MMEAKFYISERNRIVEEYEVLIRQHQEAIETLLTDRNNELNNLEISAKK